MNAARRSYYCWLLLIGLAAPLMVHGQFGAPTDDELKTTLDPNAPGAAAVYLYYEETADDTRKTLTYYERIKVLTEKGKELATVSIPYDPAESKIANVQGRTVHPDGTVFPLTQQPQSLVEFKSQFYQQNRVVFTLPNVETGSILEYRYEIRYNERTILQPEWNLQQDHFVRRAHYLFHQDVDRDYIINPRGQRMNTLMCAITGPGDRIAIRHTTKGFTLDLTNIPPAPDEDWMPPRINWRVKFYYTYAHTRDEYWNMEELAWAREVEAFIVGPGNLKNVVAAIVSPNDSAEQKARKIYAAVMKLDNTDFSRVKSEAERKKRHLREILNADDIWKNQSGTGNSIALLFVALARAAGIKAWPMEVTARDTGVFDPHYLDVEQLNDYIAIVEIGGSDVYLDPGQKMCPFGELYWAHTLTTGLRLSDNGAYLSKTPLSSSTANSVERTADLNVDEQGNVTGTARIVMKGAEALHWRQIALQNSEEELKKQFEKLLRSGLPELAEVQVDHFENLDDSESNLVAIARIGGSVGTLSSKHLFLPGLIFESGVKHPFVAQDQRISPIDLHYPETELDHVVYHSPAGWSIEETLGAGNVAWLGFGELKIDSAVTEDKVEVTRAFTSNFAVLGPENYNDLRDFYLKLAAADQQQIALTRVPAAKGN